MKLAVAGMTLVCGCLTAPGMANAGRGPLACIAPTKPADLALPIATVTSLEFYADEGSPLLSYGNEFSLVRSAVDAKGHTRNDYRVGPFDEIRATIAFIGETPVSFAVAPLKRTYATLRRSETETVSMSDIVPGIVCFSVTIETTTF